jgi:superfamily I DNA/RNA helicase
MNNAKRAVQRATIAMLLILQAACIVEEPHEGYYDHDHHRHYYDDAQSIYGARETSNKRRKFSFASVGVQAVGRTTILKLNYRNTFEILSVARAFASDLLAGEAADDDGVPIIAPESAGRRGPMPELIQCESPDAEAALIRDEVDQGKSPDDIAVLSTNSKWVATLERRLVSLGVPLRRQRRKQKPAFRRRACGEADQHAKQQGAGIS